MTPGLQVAPTLETLQFDDVQFAIFGKRAQRTLESGLPLLSERDLNLVTELQRRPRAPWSAIAEQLGVTASTASRSWQRLSREGLAWISTYPANYVAVVGYLRVSVAAGTFEDVATRMAMHPGIFWLERTDGEASLFAGFGAVNPRNAETVIAQTEAIPGVLNVRVQLSRLVVRDGSQWMPDTVAVEERDPLRGWRPAQADERPPSDSEWAAFRLLARDGRASFTELAQHSGLSERTLRRRLPVLLDRGLLNSRCDVVRESIGLPLGMIVAVDIRRGWQAVAATVSGWAATRLVALTSGPAPLLLHFWIRSTTHGTDLLERLSALEPSLRIDSVDFSLRTLKRMNRIIGPDGAVADTVDFGDGVSSEALPG